MPTIADIETAAPLEQQLNTLNEAIAGLNAGGNITRLTVQPPATGTPAVLPPATVVVLNPPITDPTTITDLTNALQGQATATQQQLTDMGFT
jgi:hypothetical protein